MKSFNKLAVLCAVLALSSSAFASPIAGTLVYDSGIQTVTGQSTFTAIAESFAFTDLSNAFAGCNNDCLTFGVLVQDGTGNTIERISYGAFTGFLSQAGFVATGGIAPTSVAANLNGGYDFNFATGLGNGSTSDFLYVQTNAKSFTLGTIGVIDNSAGSATAPIPATPEPSSLMLMGSGLVSAAGMFMRRRRVNA